MSIAPASVKLGKALAPRKPTGITFESVRKALAARNVTIRANDWGEYRINIKGGDDATAAYVSRSHDRIETLEECLAEGNAIADWHERAARGHKAATVPCHGARLETAMAAAMKPVETKRYRLGSNGLVHAPGIVAWAINGYAFKRDRARLEDVLVNGWKLPRAAAQALLSQTVPYAVDGETVVFEVAS